MLRPASPFPPNLGIVGTVQDRRQFLLDLAQANRTKLKSRLIDRSVSALFGEPGIQVAQISYFLAKAGETFRDIWHLLRSYALFGESPVNSPSLARIVVTSTRDWLTAGQTSVRYRTRGSVR